MPSISNENVIPFWRAKPLQAMTSREWEQLCDGCARCCLIKLEDEETGDVHLTRLACSLLDTKTCRCKDYKNRHARMHDCVAINAEKIKELDWLPASCAYRRLAEGRDLAWWHPLVSGTRETVDQAGISVRSWAKSEAGVRETALYRYIIEDLADV